MSDHILFDGVKYISATDAASSSGFTRDYVGKLCRIGKVRAKRVGKNWYVDQASLQSFLISQKYARSQRQELLSKERTIEYQSATASSAAKKEISTITARSEKAKSAVSAGASSLLNTPAGIGHAALQAAHVPVSTALPLLDVMHKMTALLAACVVIFGTYALVDPNGASAALGTMHRDVMVAANSSVRIIEHTPSSGLAAAAANPSAAISLAQSALENIARAVNTDVNAFIYALAFPPRSDMSTSNGVGGARGTVALTITLYHPPISTASNSAAGAAGTKVASNAPVPQTIINNTQPVIERDVVTDRVVTEGGVSESELDQRLQELSNSLTASVYTLSGANATAINQNYNVTAT
jgi:hypothetical protein